MAKKKAPAEPKPKGTRKSLAGSVWLRIMGGPPALLVKFQDSNVPDVEMELDSLVGALKPFGRDPVTKAQSLGLFLRDSK